MTICPHARRMDLPCPYPECHAEYALVGMTYCRYPPDALAFDLLNPGAPPARETWRRRSEIRMNARGEFAALWSWEQVA